jgi:hypothetical protein
VVCWISPSMRTVDWNAGVKCDNSTCGCQSRLACIRSRVTRKAYTTSSCGLRRSGPPSALFPSDVPLAVDEGRLCRRRYTLFRAWRKIADGSWYARRHEHVPVQWNASSFEFSHKFVSLVGPAPCSAANGGGVLNRTLPEKSTCDIVLVFILVQYNAFIIKFGSYQMVTILPDG